MTTLPTAEQAVKQINALLELETAQAVIDAQAADIERLTAVEHRVCSGCGSSWSEADLKEWGHISCCPERKMLTASEWFSRAKLAEASLATVKAELDGMRETAINGSSVKETMIESGGWWSPCSGCHESNEGYPTGPHSRVLGCVQGGGCRECGGIGAVWNYYTEEEFAAMERAARGAQGEK